MYIKKILLFKTIKEKLFERAYKHFICYKIKLLVLCNQNFLSFAPQPTRCSWAVNYQHAFITLYSYLQQSVCQLIRLFATIQAHSLCCAPHSHSLSLKHFSHQTTILPPLLRNAALTRLNQNKNRIKSKKQEVEKNRKKKKTKNQKPKKRKEKRLFKF